MYNAGSRERFDNIGDLSADESISFHPRNPYAIAKATTFWEVADEREAYRLFAYTGILFNHESPLQPEHFVPRRSSRPLAV